MKVRVVNTYFVPRAGMKEGGETPAEVAAIDILYYRYTNFRGRAAPIPTTSGTADAEPLQKAPAEPYGSKI